ncbi:MAG: phosphatidylserine decarboxylase family protein [Dysgonamonadaceae bacterium]|jgi:phosphatidylserine decarboxylase|nr:phosphatidylserine decarboxylase family protein [Dysgonamonadaceae bacterium]
MKIHREGRKIICYTFATLILINFTLYRVAGKTLFFYFILLLSIGIAAMIINFFRSPNRIFVNCNQGTITAPADGTVVVVEEVTENEYFHDKRLQVSIFMSLFNAHVNWIPCNGKIIEYKYQPGRFMAAYLPKSSAENERSTIVIQLDNGEKILARQIAGAMAKRIVTYAKTGDYCRINQQMGFIKFGSRVDLLLPLHADVKVKPDERVKGNRTLIAQI